VVHLKLQYISAICGERKCRRVDFDRSDGGSNGRDQTEGCSKETVTGKYPRTEWTNLSGMQGTGTRWEKMANNILAVVIVGRGTSSEDLHPKKKIEDTLSEKFNLL
jgi:hypothetical protein